MAGRGIRKIGGSGRLQARRATGGFSLLEVTLSITVLLVALLAATASTLKMAGLRRVNRERMLAQNAVRAVSERLQSLADRATTDPAGWTTAVLDGVAAGGEIGTTFDVRELTARDGAASVGTIQIVTDETITDAALGTQLGLPATSTATARRAPATYRTPRDSCPSSCVRNGAGPRATCRSRTPSSWRASEMLTMRYPIRSRAQRAARRTCADRAGFTLTEALIATSILAVVLLSSYGLLQQDTQVSQSSLGIAIAESRAQSMLHGLERELADARGASPTATLVNALGTGDTAGARVSSTLGFPPQGYLLFDRGTGATERVGYASITADVFQTLERGVLGTDPAGHAANGELLWGGLAEPIALQTNPPANLWDGRATVGGRTVFFRGDGTGFSFRTPTDPAGGNDFLDVDGLRWGSTVRGVPLAEGWSALVYAPDAEYVEARTGDDLNKDGDTNDTFDVGQIRRRTWDTDAPATPGDDVGLSPTCVLQERGRPGADLDGDGFEDPIFLWDGVRRELSVRLFVLGRSREDAPIVRKVETVIFLRNDPEG
ncbi:MAG: prepilin-type N-terminal cleavage/methylation domain-containing protein [Planctomycetes bacterium]|nr:prepilin-type N-terminal cleavage/methylation domain-containing protein [Planctomycetota bacterium]